MPRKWGSESVLHEQVADYLRLQYPYALYRTDFAAGEKLSMHQAVRNKRLQRCRAWPDLFISEPRGGFCGLFLELKTIDSSEVLASGELGNGAHVSEQREVLAELTRRGYYATFAVGFDEATKLIDTYLSHA